MEDRQYVKGKMYQWNGREFVEVQASGERKLPVTDEALEAVKKLRSESAKLIGMRPELSVVASAMIVAGASLPDAAERVRAYGAKLYAAAEDSPEL